MYKPGRELLIADTLSKAYLPNEPAPEKRNCDVFAVRQNEYLNKSIEEIYMVEFLPITAERLADFREQSEHDEYLQKLKHVVKIGGLDKKEEVPQEIRNFFHFKEEITIQDGILFKEYRVIVPAALEPLMVKKVHLSHLGVDGCLRKACDVLFWSDMLAEIKDSIDKCDTCNTYQTNQQREPLIPHDSPQHLWSHVTTDLLSFHIQDWIIIVDCWTDYFELHHLPNTTSSTIIKSLKNQFARHGIPDMLYSDNGSQFEEFASDWQFDHQTSSPHYPQSHWKTKSTWKEK